MNHQLLPQKLRKTLTLASLLVILLNASVLLPLELSTAHGDPTEADLEFSVSADCDPHANISGPKSMSLVFVSTPSRTQTGQLSATLYSPGLSPQSSTAQSWDFPEQGWHSVLFPGPLVEARFYCQEAPPTRELAITYNRMSEAVIALSQTPTVSQQELEQSGTIKKINTIPMIPDPVEPSFYSAGLDTQAPYWLTFSLPVHSPHDISTTLDYSF